MKIINIILSLLVSVPAFAGSIEFRSDDFNIQVQAKGIELSSAQVQIECMLKDGSELFTATREKTVSSQLRALGQPVGGGNLYSLSAKGSSLKLSKVFTSVGSCAYVADFAGIRASSGEAIEGRVVMAATGELRIAQLQAYLDAGTLTQDLIKEASPLRLGISPSGKIWQLR